MERTGQSCEPALAPEQKTVATPGAQARIRVQTGDSPGAPCLSPSPERSEEPSDSREIGVYDPHEGQ